MDDFVVIAPHVVGMPIAQAQRVATNAGFALAQPDPDGAPFSELTWRLPPTVTITSQRPPAGTEMRRWDSLVVTWGDERAGVREPRRPAPVQDRGIEHLDGPPDPPFLPG
ncbi:PASTA domain-containing protein [Nakamurella leprariae]|uniref:PASTA domain-containing protein n=1 Tax=Nakamurella leprariae TaxID=2803911 RepID=A0A938YB44_9ACTN|nr:PASTA domain-containing protein [Nakamurella leprariae]MBM9466378.1 PASTA domain-containing protein [Nakamurella leprariae]